MSKVLVGVLAVAMLAPRVADACSCGSGPPRVFPDGTSAVPTNVQFQIASPTIASSGMVTLTPDAGGATVSLNFTTHTDDWITAKPISALADGAAYTLHVHAVVGGNVDVPVTVSGGILDPLPYAGIDGLVLETEPYSTSDGSGGGCGGCAARDADGNVSRVRFGYADPAARFAVLVVTDAAGAQSVGTYVLPATYAHDGIIGTDVCGTPAPALVAGTMSCAHVVAYDATGRSDGDSTQRCATVDACAAYDQCMPTDDCVSPTGGGSGIPDTDAGTGGPTAGSNAGGCCSATDDVPTTAALGLGLVGLASILRPRRRTRR